MASGRDTIAAQATPRGRGGIGVIRISGPCARAIAEAMLQQVPAPRVAEFVIFRDARQRAIDQGIALFFPGPRSFTGEDVLELHGHGGQVILDQLLRRVVALGARLARPGEFSERAFLNGKLDLAQAESIADLIDSASQQAALNAMRSLQGRFSERIQSLVEQVIGLRTIIEATLDFPDEEIDLLNDNQLPESFQNCIAAVDDVFAQAHQGQLLRDGISAVIAGQPNVGKSSLLNLLAKRDRAIVSPVPGTTRDTIEEFIAIDGLPVRITDTAGLRGAGDVVEQAGIKRAQEAIEAADRVLLVTEYGGELDSSDLDVLRGRVTQDKVTIIRNKIDLYGTKPQRIKGTYGTEVYLSAKYAQGIDILENHLKECAGYQVAGEGGFSARRRHLDALRRARQEIVSAKNEVYEIGAVELAAEQLANAQASLSEITGEFTSEDLLGEIFSSFCIGK